MSANLWDGKTLSAFILKEWNIVLGARQCQRLFRQLGFRFRKSRPVIAHADLEKQQRFKKIEDLSRYKEFEVWAMDECHFQQHGSSCQMWIPPEVKDPVVLRKPTRNSVGYFGAVRLRDGEFIYLREEDRFNGETFFYFINHLRRLTARSSKRIAVIADNARYYHAILHKDWREKCQARFRLEFLPPYSPDLNPVERVWKLTRRRATHNRYFPYLEAVMMAVEGLFETWRQGSEALRRLCAI